MDTDKSKAKLFLDARHSKDRKSRTALMEAAEQGEFSTVELLLNHGADYSLQDERLCTALQMAVCSGHLLIVELLLKHAANDHDEMRSHAFLNAGGNGGKTALMDAAERDSSSMVKALLETYRIHCPERDNGGFTTLH
ncbi:hypothetical protein MMC28_011170 [Mycoblastus sanguinarius]|nr:hypothetical protein [Mycoblastus sanguinarius]